MTLLASRDFANTLLAVHGFPFLGGMHLPRQGRKDDSAGTYNTLHVTSTCAVSYFDCHYPAMVVPQHLDRLPRPVYSLSLLDTVAAES